VGRKDQDRSSGSGEDGRVSHRQFLIRLGLALLSGLMLGLAFPPSTFGILACFALVPLLIVLADVNTIPRGLGYTYAAMLVFHAITLAWTGGYAHGHDPYMMIAGTVTILVHPLFYFLPMGAYLWTRKRLGSGGALFALPFFWVAYEYSHTLSEWSFPWLTLGNTQTYDLPRIQFISTTGVLGLSLWILVINVLAFLLYSLVAHQGRLRGNRGAWVVLSLILALFLLPLGYGLLVLSGSDAATEPPRDPTITVGIIQSNADPWEKWLRSGGQVVQDYTGMTRELLQRGGGKRPDLVLWPETAIPFYLLTERYSGDFAGFRREVDSLNVAVLTGLPQAVFYKDSALAPPSARKSRMTGERYDSFNAAALIQPGTAEVQWYGKMKMVPFAERVPYADAIRFVDFLRWDVGIGGWQIGRDTTVFVERRTGARFSTLICYESVYPDFVAGFVRKGAEFISIITIDSWWGRMSGAFQHQQFAILRAVENRRWIARCAVGGISCAIDPYGRVENRTELFTRTSFARTIGRSTDLTFYTRHGEWVGLFSAWLAGAFLAAALGMMFLQRKRNNAWKSL
jgi:apolipoprotein N-acyltransferase